MEETGVRECKAIGRNQGVGLMRRVHDGKPEFIFSSLWDSFESITAFAGPAYEKAVSYPEHKEFLLKLDPHVTHYEVLAAPVW